MERKNIIHKSKVYFVHISVIYEPGFIIDGIIAAAAGVLLWISVFRKMELRRVWGIIFLICYAVYFVYLLV